MRKRKTPELILEVKTQLAEGKTQVELAKQFDCSQTFISRLKKDTSIGPDMTNLRNVVRKLSEANVRRIRAMSEQGTIYIKIARKFNISVSTVSNVVTRKTHKEIL